MSGGEYAPAAIRGVFTAVKAAIPQAALSGIVGDSAHRYGYHRARNAIGSGDYSRQLAADKAGDGWAASALDITLPASLMKTVTARLIKSAEDPDDPRMEPVREFFGTTNGRTVAGRRHDGNYRWYFASSDNSHLWHVHISFLRKYANDAKALAGVASVITGIEIGGSDMDLDDKVKLSSWIPSTWPEMSDTITVRTALGSAYGHARQAKDLIRSGIPQILAGQAAILAALDTLAKGQGANPDEVREAAEAGARAALADLVITWSTSDAEG